MTTPESLTGPNGLHGLVWTSFRGWAGVVHKRENVVSDLSQYHINHPFSAVTSADGDVYCYICKRLKLEGGTENMGVCTKERKGGTAEVLLAISDQFPALIQ